jgi:predicted nucleic acid-binding protein
MCLIIDACVLSAMLDARDPAGKLVLKWLLKGNGILAEGGKLTAESNKVGVVLSTLTELRRAGRMFDASTHDPAAFEAALARYSEGCRSNDAHVLAVAHVSGARTLATSDQRLTEDFKNPTLLPRPRGRVLHDASHGHLLKHTAGCRRPPSR